MLRLIRLGVGLVDLVTLVLVLSYTCENTTQFQTVIRILNQNAFACTNLFAFSGIACTRQGRGVVPALFHRPMYIRRGSLIDSLIKSDLGCPACSV